MIWVMQEHSISPENSKADLFCEWEKLFAQSRKEIGEIHLTDVPVYNQFFDDYLIARNGLAAGVLSEKEITALVNKLIRREGELGGLVSVMGFWFDLGKKYKEVDSEFIKYMWRQGIREIRDPYRKAAVTGKYVEKVMPADAKNLLNDSAEKIRRVLPSYDRLGATFPLEYCVWLRSFIKCSRALGVEFADLEDYLIEALDAIDVTAVSGYLTCDLLDNMAESKIPWQRKEAVMVGVRERALDLPREAEAYHTIIPGLISAYLSIGRFSTARQLFYRVETKTDTDRALARLVKYALLNEQTAPVRWLYPEYQAVYRNNEEQAGHFWCSCWYQSALALAEDNQGYYLDLPETAGVVEMGGADSHLTTLSQIINNPSYAGKTVKLRELVEAREGELVRRYNQGLANNFEKMYLLSYLILR